MWCFLIILEVSLSIHSNIFPAILESSSASYKVYKSFKKTLKKKKTIISISDRCKKTAFKIFYAQQMHG